MSDPSLDTSKRSIEADPRSAANRPTISIDQLIREHHQGLYRYAFRLTGQQCDAEDLTQQTFLTAHRKLHQLRDPDAVRGWLFRILRTAFLKTCRKRKPQLEADTEMAISDVLDQPNSAQAIDKEHLQQRLNELPEAYRIVLLMFYFEQKSYEEISLELDAPMGTVMSRLACAKAQLRIRLRSFEQVT